MKIRIFYVILLCAFFVKCKTAKSDINTKNSSSNNNTTVTKVNEKVTNETSATPEVNASKLFVILGATVINSQQKNTAYNLGKRVLNTCNTSKFKPFSATEATPEIISKMTVERISKTCQQMIRGFGKFNDIEFIEAIYLTQENQTIFRFKCDYEKKYKFKELQVTINKNNLVSAINTKDWQPEFVYEK